MPAPTEALDTQTASDLLPVAQSICRSQSFDLRGFLGGGTFKQAFLVVDASGSLLTLKIIRDPVPSRRTLREIESLARCKHPCIAKLIAHSTHRFASQQHQFILEEYIPGGSLSRRLGSNSQIDDALAKNIAIHLSDALAHLCDLGLVHRDIKPDNIIFREDGQTPVLVDFGCVRDLSASSLTQTWLLRGPGTPYFASPEQLNNQKPLIDWRTDQFALGVTLAVSRLRRHPYQHDPEDLYSGDTVERVAQRGAPSPAFLASLPIPLSPVIRMTAPWPAQRYRLPSDLLADWKP